MADFAMQLIIDPVCMLTCCPQLLHAFVYKVPVWGLNLLTPLGLMDIARFVCSRDLIIAEVGPATLLGICPSALLVSTLLLFSCPHICPCCMAAVAIPFFYPVLTAVICVALDCCCCWRDCHTLHLHRLTLTLQPSNLLEQTLRKLELLRVCSGWQDGCHLSLVST